VSLVWITRTQPGADKSAAVFKQAGYKACAAPLLTISPADEMPRPPPYNATLIFTSQNGIRAFCELTNRRIWDVVTVGDATAKHAREHGFTRVRSAGGAVEDIARLIQPDPIDEHLYVHCGGVHIRGDIVGDLKRQGRVARRDICYRSSPVRALPDIAINQCTAIVFYSPLAARTFRSFAPKCEHMSAISLSSAIDTELDGLSFTRRAVAKTPTEAALLKAAHECLR